MNAKEGAGQLAPSFYTGRAELDRPAHEFAGWYIKSAQADSPSLLEQSSGGSLTIQRQATSRLDGLLPLLAQSTRWREWAVHESARAGIRGFVQIRGWQARRVL